MRTHFLFQLSRLESARQSVNMRKSCPTCPGYPTCRNETTRPPQFVSPTRDKFTTACKRSAKFFKEVSEKFSGTQVLICIRNFSVRTRKVWWFRVVVLQMTEKNIQTFNAWAELLFFPRYPLFWRSRYHNLVVFFTSLYFKNRIN